MIIYYRQWREMHTLNGITQTQAITSSRLAIDAASAEVYVFNPCLTEKQFSMENKDPQCGKMDWGKKKAPYVAIEFENFGQRTAITKSFKVEKHLFDQDYRLPDSPNYSTTMPPCYQAAIRPSGSPVRVERIYAYTYDADPKSPRYDLTKEISSFQEGGKVLYIYGFLDMTIFGNRWQRLPFCFASNHVPCPDAWTHRSEPQDGTPPKCQESYNAHK